MTRLGSALLALVLTAALATPGLAQELSAGVKAGIDFADLGGDIEDLIETSTDLKTGFSAGAFLGIDLHRLFRLQAEAQYVQKGAKAKEAGVEGTFKLNYFEVLVPFTLLIPVEGAVIQPRLYAGPSIAFEIDCKAEVEEGGVSAEVDCDSEEVGAPTNTSTSGSSSAAASTSRQGPGSSPSMCSITWGWGTSPTRIPATPAWTSRTGTSRSWPATASVSAPRPASDQPCDTSVTSAN